MRRLIVLVVLGLVLVGCVANIEFTECPEELKGAKYCTMDYDPVCGEDGETYSNVCVACGSVDRYVMGACP